MALPRFLMLKSNASNKYLCHSNGKLGFTHDDRLSESEQDAKSIDHSRLRFEVEKSKTTEGLVHIRSCYNNKYWARKSMDSNYVAATGHESEEDQSKWTCTLFKLILVEEEEEEEEKDSSSSAAASWGGQKKKIRVLHMREAVEGSGSHGVCEDDEQLVLGAGVKSSADASSSCFTAIDGGASVILPEHVTFMGLNNKYMSYFSNCDPLLELDLSYLGFCATDLAESGVAQQLTAPTAQQTSIFNTTHNQYWSFSDLYALMYGNNEVLNLTGDSSRALQFEAVKVDDYYIALRCTANNKFVTCGAQEGPGSANPDSENITQAAKIRVGEPCVERTISDAKYDLEDARIYGIGSVEKYSDSRSNHTSVEQEGAFGVDYTTETASTWRQSTTVSVGVTVKWSAGVPKIGDFGVEVSYQNTQTWESGHELKESSVVKYNQGIRIPPGKTVTLRVLAQRALCDVPFTCTATDLMSDGTTPGAYHDRHLFRLQRVQICF